MAKFNLNDYIDVQDRINRFWNEHPDGAIRTTLVSDPNNFDQVVFRSEVYKQRDNPNPDATGIAAEAKGQGGMANSTSWHENGETSAIGRALANMGYATSGRDRPSRQEMSKTQRPPQAPQSARSAPQPANPIHDPLQHVPNTVGPDGMVTSESGMRLPASAYSVDEHIEMAGREEANRPKDMRAEALGRTLHGIADHDFLHALAVKWGFESFADVPAENRQLALDYLNGRGDKAKVHAFNGFLALWESENQRPARKQAAQADLLPGPDAVPNPRTAGSFTN